jgi:hypothetical protein
MSNESVGQGTLGTDDEEFQEWARQLGVEPHALRHAVLAVGDDPQAVQEEELDRQRGEAGSPHERRAPGAPSTAYEYENGDRAQHGHAHDQQMRDVLSGPSRDDVAGHKPPADEAAST